MTSPPTPVTSVELSKGQIFECRCLGKCTALKDDVPYMNFRDAVSLTKRKQSRAWQPDSPSTDFGRGLLFMVKGVIDHMLSINKSKRQYKLFLYVAIDTPLDRHHGVDAFVELWDCQLRHGFITTLDLSLNPAKVSKAEFVVYDQDATVAEDVGREGKYREPTELATRIAHQLWAYWFQFLLLLPRR